MALYNPANCGRLRAVKMIAEIMEPNADGTLHLPLPAAWRDRPIRVTAELEPVESRAPTMSETDSGASGLRGFGCLKGKIWLARDFDEPLEDFKEYSE